MNELYNTLNALGKFAEENHVLVGLALLVILSSVGAVFGGGFLKDCDERMREATRKGLGK